MSPFQQIGGNLPSAVSHIEQTEDFASANLTSALLQFGNSLALYAITIGLMFYLLPVSYGYVLALSVIATIAHVRLFMIGHDCAHRSYMPKAWQNVVVGNLIGVLTFTPLRYWGSQHAVHHRTTGNLDRRGAGDVVTWTVEEYEAASPMAKWWYRVNRNPWILMFVFAPIHFVLMQRWPLEQQKTSWRIWRSIMGTNIGLVIYFGSLVWLLGAEAVLLVYAPVIWLSAVVAVWLFYVQHQFDTAYWKRDDEWTYEEATLQGSSFYKLPRWGHWATGNIGYHHIHHLNPRVPNYRLAECFESNPTFQNVKTIGFFESFRFANLSVWDEARSRLVSFKSLSETAS